MAAQFASDKLHDCSGMVAVVTGGGTGLGLIVAQTLELHGAKRVYITGRRAAVLEEAAKSSTYGNIIPVQGDVNNKDDVQRLVDLVKKESGHVDVLVNNAGISSMDPNVKPTPKASEVSAEEYGQYWFQYRDDQLFKDVLNTNVVSVFTTTMAFLGLLDEGNKRRAKDAPTSQIIAIGSGAGLTRALDSYMYSASKVAVHHVMKICGAQLVPYDIRANIIAPGWFPSDMTVSVQDMFASTNGVMPRELVPRQRMGNHEEFAGTVLYLVSKAGGYCNGVTLNIDGGFLANHAGA